MRVGEKEGVHNGSKTEQSLSRSVEVVRVNRCGHLLLEGRGSGVLPRLSGQIVGCRGPVSGRGLFPPVFLLVVVLDGVRRRTVDKSLYPLKRRDVFLSRVYEVSTSPQTFRL